MCVYLYLLHSEDRITFVTFFKTCFNGCVRNKFKLGFRCVDVVCVCVFVRVLISIDVQCLCACYTDRMCVFVSKWTL